MNLTEEVAKLRHSKNAPLASPQGVLEAAQKVADRFNAHLQQLRDRDTEDAVKFLGDNTQSFKELVQIKTELETSIALCAEHDRRTRPSLTDRLSRGSFDADESKSQKLKARRPASDRTRRAAT
jgi:hypothetical protein